MAVFPKTVTFTSAYSALVYFIFFDIAIAAVLSITLPSLSVSTNLSARWRTIRSGLFVCCDLSHICSRSATAFSVSPACDQAAMANKTVPSEHHIKLLFIVDSPFVWDSGRNYLDAVPLDTRLPEMSRKAQTKASPERH